MDKEVYCVHVVNGFVNTKVLTERCSTVLGVYSNVTRAKNAFNEYIERFIETCKKANIDVYEVHKYNMSSPSEFHTYHIRECIDIPVEYYIMPMELR